MWVSAAKQLALPTTFSFVFSKNLFSTPLLAQTSAATADAASATFKLTLSPFVRTRCAVRCWEHGVAAASRAGQGVNSCKPARRGGSAGSGWKEGGFRAWRAANVAEVGVRHFTGAVHDAAHHRNGHACGQARTVGAAVSSFTAVPQCLTRQSFTIPSDRRSMSSVWSTERGLGGPARGGGAQRLGHRRCSPEKRAAYHGK